MICGDSFKFSICYLSLNYLCLLFSSLCSESMRAIFPKYAWLEEVEHQGGNPAEYSEYSPVPHPDPGSLAVRGCSQMTSAFFGVSDTPLCLCQPIISFWHAPWLFKLTMSFVNSPEPETIILEFSLFPSELTKYVLQNGSS